MDKEELGKLLDQKGNINPTLFIEKIGKSGTWENIAYTQYVQTTGEIARQEKYLTDNIAPDTSFAIGLKNKETGKYCLGCQNVKAPSSKNGGVVEGSEAKRIILDKCGKKVRRIPLYNSGFTLDITAPSVVEYTDFMLRIQHSKKEFGSNLGFPVYYFMDYVVKSEFMTMLNSLVLHSSLPGWQEKGALISNIDFADYPAIVTHVAALMYPDGFDDFKHACSRPIDDAHPQGCNHVIQIKLNILQLLRTRFGMMNEMNVAHMQKCMLSNAKVTLEDIKAYRETLGFQNKVIRFKNFEFVLRSVSMSDHLEAASDFASELQSNLKDPSEETLEKYLAPRSIQAVLPYIEAIKVFESNDSDQCVATCVNRSDIRMTLDSLIGDEDFREKFEQPMEDFISSLQLTYPCYPKFTCPACGYLPDTPKGFHVVDPQVLFFIISSRVFQKAT